MCFSEAHVDVRQLREYIDRLELAQMNVTSFSNELPVMTPDKEQAMIVQNGLASIAADVPVDQRYDILDSLNFAELAAKHDHDPEKEPEQYYKRYTNVLSRIGWVASSFSFNRVHQKSNGFKIDKAIIDVIQAGLVPGPTVLQVTNVLNALKNSGNSDQLTIFERQVSSNNQASFGITPCNYDRGQVVCAAAAFHLTSRQEHNKFLFFFSYDNSKIDFWGGRQTIELNSHTYASVRDLIIEKLGLEARQAVLEIDLFRG